MIGAIQQQTESAKKFGFLTNPSYHTYTIASNITCGIQWNHYTSLAMSSVVLIQRNSGITVLLVNMNPNFNKFRLALPLQALPLVARSPLLACTGCRRSIWAGLPLATQSTLCVSAQWAEYSPMESEL